MSLRKEVENGRFTRTTTPIVTGTSVLGLAYDGGICLAADTLGSYGSLSRFKDIKRIHRINDNTLVAFSGDLSDMQEVLVNLNDLITNDLCRNDGVKLSAREVHSHLVVLLHRARNKMNPLWNSILVAGYEENTGSFLGFVDLYGTSFEGKEAATGLGSYMALPLLREAQDAATARGELLSANDARYMLEEAMKVLVYRDGRQINRIQFATVDAAGVQISEPYALATIWEPFRDLL